MYIHKQVYTSIHVDIHIHTLMDVNIIHKYIDVQIYRYIHIYTCTYI